MNIYLDIDGVILGTASPKEDIVKFITYILDHFPDSTYWLTTHCRHGENRCTEWLMGNLPDELVDRMAMIVKPTDWEAVKTEAIDMDQDFIWFDDTLFETERRILESYYVAEDFFKMNPKDPDMAKKALNRLREVVVK